MATIQIDSNQLDAKSKQDTVLSFQRQKELVLVEMVNGTWAIGMLGHVDDQWIRLENPRRLIMQRDQRDQVALGMAPWIPFISNKMQNVEAVEIQKTQVVVVLEVEKVITDGGRFSSHYLSETTGIALANVMP